MARRVNLLFLRDTTFVCGPGKTILNTYRTLDRGRFSLTLAVPGNAENAFVDRARELGIEVIRIPARGPLDPSAILRLARLLRERSIDIVQSHDFLTRRLAIAASALTGVCHITSVHGWIANTRKQRISRRIDHVLIRRARCAVVVSDRLATQVQASGMPAERVRLLRNAVLLEDYAPVADARTARLELGLPADAEVVSIVGRLSREKGHELFLEAARHVASERPRARFLIVGHGALRDHLERVAQSSGIADRVSFLGLRSDMHRIYAATDVLALCSTTEGLPNVVLEAFAYARPVVATKVGGVPEVITDGVDGLIVEPANLEAMVSGIGRLLRDKVLAEEMGRRGRTTIQERFDFKKRTDALEALYDSLTAERISPAVGDATGVLGGTH